MRVELGVFREEDDDIWQQEKYRVTDSVNFICQETQEEIWPDLDGEIEGMLVLYDVKPPDGVIPSKGNCPTCDHPRTVNVVEVRPCNDEYLYLNDVKTNVHTDLYETVHQLFGSRTFWAWMQESD